MKKVIVTGATGFIGHWLVEELLDNGIDVTIIVRSMSRVPREFINRKYCKVILGDINESLSNQFEKGEFECFFHLAWEGVAPEMKNNTDIQMKNIELGLSALELAHKLKCAKFISAGTVAEYVFCKDVMNVNEKQTPNDMYGAAKVALHYFLDVRSRQLNQPFIWMVLPSTYGEGRLDKNIITYTIISLLNGEKPQYGNLEQMWDFLYVGDVVRAIRLIGESGINGKVYGIGSGQYRPLKDYICLIRDIINPELELGIGEIPLYSEQTFSSCVNTFDLVHDTGFQVSISFEDGIKRTIEAMKKEMVVL